MAVMENLADMMQMLTLKFGFRIESEFVAAMRRGWVTEGSNVNRALQTPLAMNFETTP